MCSHCGLCGVDLAEWLSLHISTYTRESAAAYELLEVEGANLWACLDRAEEVLCMCGLASEPSAEDDADEDAGKEVGNLLSGCCDDSARERTGTASSIECC